jgi:hypothetical protein
MSSIPPPTTVNPVIADRQQVVRIDDLWTRRSPSSSAPNWLSALRRVGRRAARHHHRGLQQGRDQRCLRGQLQRLAGRAGFYALDPPPGNPLNVPGLSLMT